MLSSVPSHTNWQTDFIAFGASLDATATNGKPVEILTTLVCIALYTPFDETGFFKSFETTSTTSSISGIFSLIYFSDISIYSYILVFS